ncbi:MAG: enoyl-CoA hydratase-related protein [Bacteroidota bacterium]|nr:enoyl-CoA hydratase-related protein [Bacteroidota bacterium]MDP4250046.1 enoyl-CoA hydratase-related protein [Bacteroidota bacterium]
MYQTLLTVLAGNILSITINRPEKLNALNQTVIRELGEVVEEIYQNPVIRAAIITGSGNKAFVAGADISGFAGLGKEEGRRMAKEGLDIFFKIENSPKPIVAAVNGFALGGGCELAMACHFRLCSDTAQFGQPEVNLGLIPGYGGTQRLTRLIGKGRSMEALLTGNLINASLALQYGLVNYITTPEDLMEKTKLILQQITSKGPLAVAKCIAAANAATGGQEGFELETESFAECFATADMKEGTAAFLEKRKPVFKGI